MPESVEQVVFFRTCVCVGKRPKLSRPFTSRKHGTLCARFRAYQSSVWVTACRVTDRHPRPPPPHRDPCRRLAASADRHRTRDHRPTPREVPELPSSGVSAHTPGKVAVPCHQPTTIGEFPRAFWTEASTATALSLEQSWRRRGPEIATTSSLRPTTLTCRHPQRTSFQALMRIFYLNSATHI